MATFDDLLNLSIEWENRILKYKSDSWQFVYRLADGLIQYIGAPKSYQDVDKSLKSYVQPLQVTRLSGDIIEFNHAPESISDVITDDGNGYWLSGIKIVVGREHVLPKPYFMFPIRFIIRETQCELHIGGKNYEQFDFDVQNFNPASKLFPDGVMKAYDYMIEYLRKTLILTPWSAQEKTSIGFVSSQPSAEHGPKV